MATPDPGKALLREIDPKRRFWRNFWLYALIFATIFAVVRVPEEWPLYALIFLAGTHFMLFTIYFEEKIDLWLDKATES